jgi:hypothetical protein
MQSRRLLPSIWLGPMRRLGGALRRFLQTHGFHVVRCSG